VAWFLSVHPNDEPPGNTPDIYYNPYYQQWIMLNQPTAGAPTTTPTTGLEEYYRGEATVYVPNKVVQYPDGGYGLGGNSYEMIREYFRGDTKDYFKLDSSPKQIFSAISSDNNFPVQKIVSKLAGKYFGAFRFIGHYYSNGEGRLEWIHGEDHSRILISSVTSSNIEIVAYNVSKVAINKFLNILRHVLIDYQILVEFSNTTSSQVN